MFDGFATSIVKAAWIVAAPFWCIVIALGAIVWHLNEQRKRNRP